MPLPPGFNDFFDRNTDSMPGYGDFFERNTDSIPTFEMMSGEQPAQSFFDYALQKASDPISQIMGVMDPYGAPQSGAGGGGFGQDIFGNSGNSFFAGMATLGARAKNSLVSADRAATMANRSVASPGLRQVTASGGPSDVNEYLKVAARRAGIDPAQVLAVMGKEGPTGWGSVGRFDTGESYGPLQLHYAGGSNPKEGMGDRFTRATGIDLRKDSSIQAHQAAVDFAMQELLRTGNWSEWYGADNALPGGRFTPITRITPEQISGGLPGPAALAAQMRAQTAGPAAPGETSSYAQHATTPASEYSIAFDFDQAYDNPWSASIPRHRGIDLTVKGAPNGGRGSRVGAFVGGTVVATTSDPAGGNGVIVRTDDGLYNYYGHFDSIVAAQGQRVERGTPLGILGASGTEGFPHLHYEVRRGLNGDPMGQLIDPRPYLNGAR